ncbi:hypothetical protein DMB37_40200 [Nocardia sp. CS682]|nr:hypothetical protein DMB37_40200 [Nocardia sp. CS682]
MVTELLSSVVGTPLPEFDHAHSDSGDLPDIRPTEYRADLVVTLTSDNVPVFGIVIEVQLKPDKDKCWSWPVYLTTLRARQRCPVLLVVLCPNQHAATHCRQPITVSPGFILTPVVLGPADVPVITDPQSVIAHPDLTVLSAIAHRNDPERDAILFTLAETMHCLPARNEYIDVIMAALPAGAARHFWEMLMTTKSGPYLSAHLNKQYAKAKSEGMAEGKAKGMAEGMAEGKAKGKAEGKAEGVAEGKAQSLLTVLAVKRLHTTPQIESKVNGCTDPAQLDRWTRRAITADSIEEVFAD